MNWKNYESLINKKTKAKLDLSPLFQNPKVFKSLIKDLKSLTAPLSFNLIVGLEASGFLPACPLAHACNVGFIPIRKKGGLPSIPSLLISQSCLDYSGTKKTLQINKFAVSPGDKILLVDEWIETGAQMKAAIKLIERLGGKVVGCLAIGATKRSSNKILFDKYNLQALNLTS